MEAVKPVEPATEESAARLAEAETRLRFAETETQSLADRFEILGGRQRFVARQVSGMLRGCRTVVVGSMIGTESILMRAADQCAEWGWCAPGEPVVAVHGMLEGRPGATNVCRVLSVPSK